MTIKNALASVAVGPINYPGQPSRVVLTVVGSGVVLFLLVWVVFTDDICLKSFEVFNGKPKFVKPMIVPVGIH